MRPDDEKSALKAKFSEAVHGLSFNKLDEKTEFQYLTRIAMAIINEDVSLEDLKNKLQEKHINELRDYLGDDLKTAAWFIFRKYDKTDSRIFNKIKFLKDHEKGLAAILSIPINQEVYDEFIKSVNHNTRELFEQLCDQEFQNSEYEEVKSNKLLMMKIIKKSKFISEAFETKFISERQLMKILKYRRSLKNIISLRITGNSFEGNNEESFDYEEQESDQAA